MKKAKSSDLAERDRSLKPRVLKILERAAGTDSPALVSRGKKLIKTLKGNG
ncbi:MAG: hypothetical protein JRJ73_11320 [Deltaproteobacteria bacterium]|nr:hypothetical protein [Deltaproteobacteria bacterium]